ncbi:GerMN domain-containing protein [Oscillatoria salina]|uniref:GerMN domain-containing protein n=1 Tax=Oscillatoria salina TaxID=331517 RepID=UPI0013BB070D|nr:GerMN domain-containing protein [Oscillatoria salina]MBZ8180355.1 GerMN domain-containing protein [Oscillatoria salina IIICB1]NET87953.1 GerMN domain-containing protein [Kamptonema sp. SIO1D9]
MFKQKSILINCGLFFSLAGVTACSNNVSNVTGNPESNQIAQPNNQTANESYNVQVYFPEAGGEFTDTEAVTRTTESAAVAEFALEELIAGPTFPERERGLIDPIEFRGESNCGENFTVGIKNGEARVQFCRDVVTQGVGDDARIQTSIKQTLKQFSTVDSVVILDKNGNCFADASGRNQCLSAETREVQVYFPEAGGEFTDTEAVTRTTESVAVAEFALEKLIAGPTFPERERGLIDPIEFRGESNCGENFTVGIENGEARVQFCRDVVTQGVGDDARIQTSIKQTLKQFSTVDSVVILDKNGNCFADASGRNLCLQSA